MPVPLWVNAPLPLIAPDSVRPAAPPTASPPAPSVTLLPRFRPGTAPWIAPPLLVMVPVPSDALLSMIAVPPFSVASCTLDAPLTVQVPLPTCICWKLMYWLFEIAPVAGPPAFCWSTSVLSPPWPPSTVPVAAKPTVIAPIPRFSDSPVPPAAFTDDPVAAVNVLLLFAPIDTLPLMVPELVKVLPTPGVPDAWNPTRPSIVPLLLKLTWAPPYAATTGASAPSSVAPMSPFELMVPVLVRFETPPVPFCTPSAMPVTPLRLTPVEPFIVPLLVTVVVLAVALPMSVPLDSTPSPVPSADGSIVPLLVSVVPLPDSDSAVPPTPSSTPRLAPELTVTFRLLELFE